jgi:ubiquinol-cytochrome c reductase cytochrome b subunit
VGLIEGDGWFSVSKKGKYVLYELGLELSIKDIQLIYKIKKLLGVGTVYFRNKAVRTELKSQDLLNKSDIETNRNNVVFRIRNKSHLKEIIVPIFDKYPLLTNKQHDYIRFRTGLLSNIIYSKDLIPYTRSEIPINSVESILNASYFSS